MNARDEALARLRAYLGVEGDTVTLRASQRAPWIDDFLAAAPWLRFEAASSSELHVRGSKPHGAITFVGPVEGRLLESLAEALRALATGAPSWDTPASPARLAELEAEAALRVFVGATCPFCPSVTAAALRVAVASTLVAVEILRADVVGDDTVTSVPTVRLGDETLSVGAVGEYALVDRLVAAR